MLALCSVVLCSRPSVPAGSASADAEVQLCYTVYTVLYKGYGHLWIFFFFLISGGEGRALEPSPCGYQGTTGYMYLSSLHIA